MADGGEGCGWAEVVAGRVVRRRPLRVAHVRQNHLDQLGAHLRETVAAYAAACVGRSLLEAWQRLGSVGLGGSALAKQPVGSLSGGERVRLVLAVEVVAARPHLVVLDEPTNHLDGESLAALVVALNEFEGAVLCVSHHREFVASFATEIWRVEDEGRVASTHVASRVEAEAQLEAYAAQLRGGGAKAEGQKPNAAAAYRRGESSERGRRVGELAALVVPHRACANPRVTAQVTKRAQRASAPQRTDVNCDTVRVKFME